MKTFFTALLLSSTLLLSACNTMEGMGKDVEKGGEALKNEAREEKTY
jgi:predicted small secreted protein